MYLPEEPPPIRQRRASREFRTSYEAVLLCFGLVTLLHVQYEHEGHMDEPVFAHALHILLETSEELKSRMEQFELEDIPF